MLLGLSGVGGIFNEEVGTPFTISLCFVRVFSNFFLVCKLN